MKEEKEIKRDKRHVQVPHSVSDNVDSDKKSKYKKHYTDILVYGFLRKNMNNETRVAFISLKKIAESCGMSVGGITAAITRLESVGDIEKIKMEGGRNQNGYKFNPKSEKFEMYDLHFLEHEGLNTLQKAFYMTVQPVLYNKETGVGKTTYNDEELANITGLSKTVVKERRRELEALGFINRRLTTDQHGNSCEALEFDLMKFGQYVVCKFDIIEDTLQKQQKEIEALKQQMKQVLKDKLEEGQIII